MSKNPPIAYKLMIFTRYPEPGLTKTRLIPLLGAEGAADLHQRLTEYTLNQCLSLHNSGFLSIDIYFSGGSVNLMQSWLGTQFNYKHQGEGNLGEKMARAFQQSFVSGHTKVVIIGSDCPDLTQDIIYLAFHQLNQVELVLGPAQDGGYYLMGLRRFIPQLFQLNTWGTSEVFSQTQQIADSLNLTYLLLPILADIDRPEDVKYFNEKPETGFL